jgi:hypothetical protein
MVIPPFSRFAGRKEGGNPPWGIEGRRLSTPGLVQGSTGTVAVMQAFAGQIRISASLQVSGR